jgi:hypothetical protein
MTLVWNDARSFQRHLEAMRAFRLSHSLNTPHHRLVKDMPNPYHLDLTRGEKLITCLTDSRGRAVIVPIWEITAPAGSQN